MGIWIGPPNALLAPKPMSSISTMTTLGAPSGALTSKRGGALASRASSVVMGFGFGSVDRQHGAVEGVGGVGCYRAQHEADAEGGEDDSGFHAMDVGFLVYQTGGGLPAERLPQGDHVAGVYGNKKVRPNRRPHSGPSEGLSA